MKNFIVNENNVSEHISKIGEFIQKYVNLANGKGVVLGMSGGVDCSVVARLAQTAGVKVHLVLLPHGMEKKKSIDDSMVLINRFEFDYEIIDIKDICKELDALKGNFSEISKINIRPRVRMTILYAIAQTMDYLVMGTGNLDERLLGYFTKWGDGGCDLNPLGMLTKGEVRLLARHLGVPDEIINKAPSADLFEGQTDEGDFGFTYDQMDKYILEGSSKDVKIDQIIEKKIAAFAHKLDSIPLYYGN